MFDRLYVSADRRDFPAVKALAAELGLSAEQTPNLPRGLAVLLDSSLLELAGLEPLQFRELDDDA